LWIYGFSR